MYHECVSVFHLHAGTRAVATIPHLVDSNLVFVFFCFCCIVLF